MSKRSTCPPGLCVIAALLLALISIAPFGAWAQDKGIAGLIENNGVLGPAAKGASGCLDPTQVPDADGDFTSPTVRDLIAKQGLCVRVERFSEGGQSWTLQIVEGKRRSGPLWAVPHDNENAAFVAALYALVKYGGTLIAVETGGSRNNQGVDPNRIFGTRGTCPRGVPAHPKYTRMFKGSKVIAVHTNAGGGGTVSIMSPAQNSTAHPATKPVNYAASPNDTLVYVASRNPDSRRVRSRVDKLNKAGVNVILEHVTAKNSDCSMSNYMALAGRENAYAAVEAVHDDVNGLIKLIDIVVAAR